jgi:hypothetical protein
MAVVSGGTTLIDNGALDAGVPTGSLILLSTQTASASASISFTSGIDSTYDSYVFKFIEIHGSSEAQFSLNFSTDGGSNYNVVKTTSKFGAYHDEANTVADIGYDGNDDIAQGTGFVSITTNGSQDNDNDHCMNGTMFLFNPSSTTFVKHFITTTSFNLSENSEGNAFNAGYANTTSAVNAIQFKFTSGNIDDGIIKMYGVK